MAETRERKRKSQHLNELGLTFNKRGRLIASDHHSDYPEYECVLLRERGSESERKVTVITFSN